MGTKGDNIDRSIVNFYSEKKRLSFEQIINVQPVYEAV